MRRRTFLAGLLAGAASAAVPVRWGTPTCWVDRAEIRVSTSSFGQDRVAAAYIPPSPGQPEMGLAVPWPYKLEGATYDARLGIYRLHGRQAEEVRALVKSVVGRHKDYRLRERHAA